MCKTYNRWTTETNQGVIKMWKQGKNARNGRRTLVSFQGNLYSYRLKIGHRHPNGAAIVADFTAPAGHYRSQTTSCHVNLAKREADEVFHPLLWKTTNMFEDEVPF